MFQSNKQDVAERHRDNPLITPADVKPSRDDLEVIGAFNPGVFEYQGRIGLLLRVAERPHQEPGYISTITVHPDSNQLEVKRFHGTDPYLDTTDPRVIQHRGFLYLTSISHLRLAWSDDGEHFQIEPTPAVFPEGVYETYGVEDARVTEIDGTYHITYSAVSDHEVAVSLATTKDWQHYQRHGPILQPFNKDVCLFAAEDRSKYWIIHRPSGVMWKRNWMWISESPDLAHWGRPRCLAQTRMEAFDSARLGAGGPPLPTNKGHLEIYHGADEGHRYCLGAMLLDQADPYTITARSPKPLMEPIAPYEQKGFFGNVVFTDGGILRDDHIWMYYAASDTVTCLARIPLRKVWKHLEI